MKTSIYCIFILCVVVAMILAFSDYWQKKTLFRQNQVTIRRHLSKDILMLEKKKLQLEQEKLNLEILKVEDEQRDLPFRRHLKNYGLSLALFSFLISLLFLAYGLYHKYSVHEIRIGKHSVLKVRYKDMATLGAVQNGLVLSEQLKADPKTEERGLEFSLKLSQIVVDQLRAISGRQGLFRHIANSAESASQALPAGLAVPTFHDLLQSNQIGPQRSLIYGFRRDTGQPEIGPLKHQYSIFTIGLPGFGKTVHAAYFIASAILTEQARFDVLDLHYPDEESLGYALGDLINTEYVNLITNPYDVPALLQDYRQEMKTRANLPKGSYHARILVVDENTIWIKHIKDLVRAESEIIEEGRKFGLYVLLTSKSAKADKMGGDSDIKNQCTTSYCFRTSKPVAHTFFHDSDKEALVQQLREPGECVFTNRFNDSCIMAIPYTSRDDMHQVCEIVGNTVVQSAPAPVPIEAPKKQIVPNPELAEMNQLFDDLLDVQEPNNVVQFPQQISLRDQLKKLLENAEQSYGKISQATGISKSTVHAFVNGSGALKSGQIDALRTFMNDIDDG